MIRNFKDHANNERTFLAWVRTATTIVGFGLAAGRIGGAVPPLWTELALFASGFLLVVVALGRMVWLRRRIERSETLDDGGLAADIFLFVLVAVLMGVLALFGWHLAT